MPRSRISAKPRHRARLRNTAVYPCSILATIARDEIARGLYFATHATRTGVACRERTRRQQGVFQRFPYYAMTLAWRSVCHFSRERDAEICPTRIFNVCDVSRACRGEGSAKGTRNSKAALGYAHSQVRTRHASHVGALIVRELSGFIGFRCKATSPFHARALRACARF